MKNLMILLSLLLGAVRAQAQAKQVDTIPGHRKIATFNLAPKLIMPDGSVVLSSRMDSIKKVLGSEKLMFSVHDDGTYVHAVKTDTEQAESEATLSALLMKPAPAFILKDMHGNLVSLSGLKGKVVVLNFWFTQCGACIEEMPELNQLWKSYNDKAVVFLGITYDDRVKAKDFLSRNKFNYTILTNAKKVCETYHIWEYPTSAVIDQNGTIRFITAGINSAAKTDLMNAINTCLAGTAGMSSL